MEKGVNQLEHPFFYMKKRNGDWFYLDEEGEIATNQRVDDYFVNDEGHMAKNQWVSAENEISYDSPDSPDGGSWLYFGKDGKIVTAKGAHHRIVSRTVDLCLLFGSGYRPDAAFCPF